MANKQREEVGHPERMAFVPEVRKEERMPLQERKRQAQKEVTGWDAAAEVARAGI